MICYIELKFRIQYDSLLVGPVVYFIVSYLGAGGTGPNHCTFNYYLLCSNSAVQCITVDQNTFPGALAVSLKYIDSLDWEKETSLAIVHLENNIVMLKEPELKNKYVHEFMLINDKKTVCYVNPYDKKSYDCNRISKLIPF